MTLENDDLRAAVGAGLISEAQAAGLIQLADQRRGYRTATMDVDEPFELFKGFNEIFIVVGLIILYAGWSAITGISVFTNDNSVGSSLLTYGIIQVIVTAALTYYFTLKRRMIGPSILLSLLFGQAGLQIGYGIFKVLAQTDTSVLPITFGTAALFLIGYWYIFRIPFSLMLSGLAIFVFAVGVTTGGGISFSNFDELFLLTTSWSASIVTISLGLCAFIVAMRFDMSDPHRVTRRAANGFWLHILAAPAIVNSIALTLYTNGTIPSFVVLIAFLILIALVAVIIDRRSFLMSGIGYMIALITTVLDGGYGLMVLILGGGLVLLGSNWEKLRTTVLRALPNFKGKDKLPPWNDIVKETK